jgi:hypothetical protein
LDVANKYEPEFAKSMSKEELLALRTDPATSTRMANHLTNENKRILERKDIATTNDNLYLLHFGGPSSGVRAITAADDTKAEDIFTPGQLNANPFLKGMTAKEIRAWSKGKVGGESQAATTDVPQIFSNAVADEVPSGEYFPSTVATDGIAVPPIQVPKEVSSPYTDDGVRNLSMEEVDSGIPVPETTIEVGPETTVQTALDKYGYPINAPMTPEIQTDSVLDPDNDPYLDAEERMKQMHGGNSVGTGYQASTLRDKHAEYVKQEEAAGRPALGFKDWADANGMYGLQDKPTEESAADLEFGDAGSEPAAITDEQRAKYVEKQRQKLQEDIAKGDLSEEDIKKRQAAIERAEKGVSPNTKDGLVGGERRDDILTDEDLDSAITADNKNKQAYADKIAEQTKGAETPTETPDDVAATGDQSSDDEKNTVMDFFREYGLADLYDKQELGRMVAMYLGSRALGYSHAGSLNFSVKNYAKRVDAKADLHRKRVDALLKEGIYSKSSIAAFEKSRDIDDLVKSGLDYTPQGTYETIEINTGTVENPKWVKTKVQKVKGSDDGYYWQAPTGQIVPMESNQVRIYDKKLDPNTPEGQTYYAEARADAESIYKGIRSEFEEDDLKGSYNAQSAAKDFTSWTADKKLNPKDPRVQGVVGIAYRQMLADHAKGIKSNNLEHYLTMNYMAATTGSVDLWITNPDEVAEGKPPQTLSGDEVMKVTTKAKNFGAAMLPNVAPQVAADTIIKHAMKKFAEEDQEYWKEAAEKASSGKHRVSAFSLYLTQKIDEFKKENVQKTYQENN